MAFAWTKIVYGNFFALIRSFSVPKHAVFNVSDPHATLLSASTYNLGVLTMQISACLSRYSTRIPYMNRSEPSILVLARPVFCDFVSIQTNSITTINISSGGVNYLPGNLQIIGDGSDFLSTFETTSGVIQRSSSPDILFSKYFLSCFRF
jgi:hypothetical protein